MDFVMFVPPKRKYFPDPRVVPTESGIICVGGEMSAEVLQEAYAWGIFPWPHDDLPLLWFCPDERGVLDFKDLHLPKSFQKWLKKNESQIEIRFNHDFKAVITRCAEKKRKGQKGTWITNEIKKAYVDLFKEGHAFSLECYREKKMIAGIYGVKSLNYCSCESMFFEEPNASKLAFYKLIQKLQSEGLTWVDIQMVTDISGQFGGKYITKRQFLKRVI